MTNEPTDPLFDALFRLTPVAPRESHDRRVLRRCHKVLAERRARSRPSPRPGRLSDLMVAAGVTIYIIAMVNEAARLLGAMSG